MSKRVEVAVGVLCRFDGSLLLQQRRPGTACAGQWEFPGGKLEQREPVETALIRELEEELGIVPVNFQPLSVLEHDYAHARVRLHTFWVRSWLGVVGARETQVVRWLAPDAARKLDLLEAAYPLLEQAQARMLAER